MIKQPVVLWWKKLLFEDYFFSTDGAKITSFSFIPLFHRFCNTNKCKCAVSLFPRARVTGILLFFLSQVSHLLSYNAVNDSVIDVFVVLLTVWESLFLKKSFRGVEIVGWMCGENPPKIGREKKLVWHLWQQKNNIAAGRRAHTRVCACVCAHMRESRVEMVAHLCALVRFEPSRMRVAAWRGVFDVASLLLFTRWTRQ